MRFPQRVTILLDDATVVLATRQANIHAGISFQEHLFNDGILLLIEKLADDILPDGDLISGCKDIVIQVHVNIMKFPSHFLLDKAQPSKRRVVSDLVTVGRSEARYYLFDVDVE